MLTEIPEGRGPGTWVRTLHYDATTGVARWSAVVCCPTCRARMHLNGHRISDSGQVSPSVGHPDGSPPCPWHVTPRLLGWAPTPPLPPPLSRSICERCKKTSFGSGGWGTWNGGPGIICAECFKEHMAQFQ